MMIRSLLWKESAVWAGQDMFLPGPGFLRVVKT